jgi:hypothetical protein
MRLRTAFGLLCVMALVAAFIDAPEPASSPRRLKSFTFCGPDWCWSMPARATDGRDITVIGEEALRPRVPVRFYRARLQYGPRGRGDGLFVPALGLFRIDDVWWKLPRSTAVKLRHATRQLRAFGPSRV